MRSAEVSKPFESTSGAREGQARRARTGRAGQTSPQPLAHAPHAQGGTDSALPAAACRQNESQFRFKCRAVGRAAVELVQKEAAAAAGDAAAGRPGSRARAPAPRRSPSGASHRRRARSAAYGSCCFRGRFCSCRGLTDCSELLALTAAVACPMASHPWRSKSKSARCTCTGRDICVLI